MSKAERIKRTLDVGLLEEFTEYGSILKAKIVYRKCLQNRKFEIAKRIKIKYKLVDKYDDRVMVLGFALMAQANCCQHRT